MENRSVWADDWHAEGKSVHGRSLHRPSAAECKLHETLLHTAGYRATLLRHSRAEISEFFRSALSALGQAALRI